MPQRVSGVYAIRNTITGDCYIGSSVNMAQRWSKHRHQLRHGKHENQHLQLAFNKYGFHSFEFGLIEEVPEREKLIEREQYWIDHLKPRYNKMLVVQGVWRQSPEAIEKIKAVRAAQEVTEDMLNALAQGRQKRLQSDDPLMLKPRLGMKNSEETRRKQSDAAKKRPPHPAEVIERIAAKRRGMKDSDETRRKKSEKLTGRPVSEENRQKFAERSREMWANRTPEEKRAIVEKRSEEVQEKNRQRMRELGKDPNRIEKSRQATLGIKRSEATRQKQREAWERRKQRQLENPKPPVENTKPAKEYKYSEERRARMSEGKKASWDKKKAAQAENIEQQNLFGDSSE